MRNLLYMATCHVIYMGIIIFKHVGIYDLTRNHPFMIMGYISTAHLAALPVGWWTIRGHAIGIGWFLLFNTIHLFLVVLMVYFFQSGFGKYILLLSVLSMISKLITLFSLSRYKFRR